MKERKINVKLFKKIIKFVEADLRRLEMSFYGVKKDTEDAYVVESDIVNEGWAACGTKACCAGWAVLLSTPKSKWKTLFKASGEMKSTTHSKARKLLGLNEGQAMYIFQGESIYRDTGEKQLATLREEINEVLQQEGIEDRV